MLCWRSGSALDSDSKGHGFKSRTEYFFCTFLFLDHTYRRRATRQNPQKTASKEIRSKQKIKNQTQPSYENTEAYN